MAASKKDYRPETRLVHAGTLRSQFGEMSEALFLTQGYLYPSAEECEARFSGKTPGYIYSRYSNPTMSMFEQRMAALEGAEAARSTATGMAAVTTSLMGLVRQGDHVVAAKALFGSCRWVIEEWLARFGVTFTLVDGEDIDQWQKAVTKNTKVFFMETPTNPTLQVYDIAAVAKIAHAAGAKLVVDNVFATPLYQSPLKLGADVVVYSATKHIDGQGRALGGAILASEKYIKDDLGLFYRHTGPSLSPFNAWLLLKGLETLELRVERQCRTALAIARFLESHPKIARVVYPGLPSHPQYDLARRQMKEGGTVAVFDIAGDKEACFRFLDALRLVDISNNLGDAKSLVTHPATTTHSRLKPEERAALGIGDGLVRLSAGLEAEADLIADLSRALDAV